MLIENLKEAYSGIRSNKMRSLLTMLGIIIGISAVITITTIGSSIRSTLNSSLNSLGGNMIELYVSPRYPETDEEWDTWMYVSPSEDDYIPVNAIKELSEQFDSQLEGLVITQDAGAGEVNGENGRHANVRANAANGVYLDYMKLKIKSGRSISEEDQAKGKNVCVISDRMASNYFKGKNPLGQQITIDTNDGRTYDLVVIGVYEYSNAVFGREDTSVREEDRVTTVFFPEAYYSNYMGADHAAYEYMDFMMKSTVEDSEALMQAMMSYLNENYYADSDFRVDGYNNQSSMGMIDTVISVVTIAISVIAAISLIVGGVGVMNIMLVSITERTREIGIRMAMGAKRSTIRSQFIIEAIMLCLIGGGIGIIIGILNGFLLGGVASMLIQSMASDYAQFIILEVRPSIPAIIFSVLFSGLTGVFFGYYPANKASKMEVIDALRYE